MLHPPGGWWAGAPALLLPCQVQDQPVCSAGLPSASAVQCSAPVQCTGRARQPELDRAASGAEAPPGDIPIAMRTWGHGDMGKRTTLTIMVADYSHIYSIHGLLCMEPSLIKISTRLMYDRCRDYHLVVAPAEPRPSPRRCPPWSAWRRPSAPRRQAPLECRQGQGRRPGAPLAH
jgi:hypothetical protein